jgi:antitoxin component HigA of HigAB toxin-antitoxin module
MTVRLVNETVLQEMGKRSSKGSAAAVSIWTTVVRAAQWRGLADVQRAYHRTGVVKGRDGRQAMLFRLEEGQVQILAAVHWKLQLVYLLACRTGSDMNDDDWEAATKSRSRMDFARVPKDYAGLCRLLLPRPIRSRSDLERVKAITDVMAGQKLNPEQEDYFELLSRLLGEYEQEQTQTARRKVSGYQALCHLFKEQQLNGADLGRMLGTHRTLGPMILRGDRNLTVEHIRKLCAHFSVSSDLFVTKA